MPQPPVWAKLVIERDKKCCVCGSTENLHARHLFTWKLRPELKFKVEGGVTVCKQCYAEHRVHVLQPRNQATVRRPYHKTMQKMVSHLEANLRLAEERIAVLTEENQRLRGS